MIKNVVKVPFQKLKHIHHISDIQIRNLKRHTEYEEVFNRLYEKVKENKDNAVAYIGGDIAHSKTEMSPELVDQLSRLFKNLADICPTIIIAGNHDCNLNNRSRLDVFTPIVDNLNHPNLHYLKDSGVYKCADTTFVVWDCWTDEKDFILSKDKVVFEKFFLNLIIVFFILFHSSFSLRFLDPVRVDSPPMSTIEAPSLTIDLIFFFCFSFGIK